MEKTQIQVQSLNLEKGKEKVRTVVNALRAEMQESTTQRRRIRRAD